jgi:hypothetical protein
LIESEPNMPDPSSVPDGACVVCGCDLPFDEVVVPEATPYVVRVCGLDCYARWRRQAERALGLQDPLGSTGRS